MTGIPAITAAIAATNAATNAVNTANAANAAAIPLIGGQIPGEIGLEVHRKMVAHFDLVIGGLMLWVLLIALVVGWRMYVTRDRKI